MADILFFHIQCVVINTCVGMLALHKAEYVESSWLNLACNHTMPDGQFNCTSEDYSNCSYYTLSLSLTEIQPHRNVHLQDIPVC